MTQYEPTYNCSFNNMDFIEYFSFIFSQIIKSNYNLFIAFDSNSEGSWVTIIIVEMDKSWIHLNRLVNKII